VQPQHFASSVSVSSAVFAELCIAVSVEDKIVPTDFFPCNLLKLRQRQLGRLKERETISGDP
jgi:hypothetical protein